MLLSLNFDVYNVLVSVRILQLHNDIQKGWKLEKVSIYSIRHVH